MIQGRALHTPREGYLQILGILFITTSFFSGAVCITAHGARADLGFSEILFDPDGEDRGAEFVEIISDVPIDLSGAIFADAASEDSLHLVQQGPSEVILLVDDAFNLSRIPSDASIYSGGSLLGNGLGNSGDTLALLSENRTMLLNTSYPSPSGVGGYSIVLHEGVWMKGSLRGGTPGLAETPLLSEQPNSTDNVSDNGTINESDPLQDDQAHTQACAPSFSIRVQKDVVANKERIPFTFLISPAISPMSISYGIEDIFGDVKKDYRQTTNLAEKSYTPTTDRQVDVIIIRAELESPCLSEPLFANRTLIVTNPTASAVSDTSDVSDSGAEKASDAPSEKKNLVLRLENATLIINQSLPFITSLVIENDDAPHRFQVWGYVYKGSVSYSGERDAGLQTVSLSSGKTARITLTNRVRAPAGSASFKVKILKDDLKTPYEITQEVLILPDETIGAEDPSVPNQTSASLDDIIHLLDASPANGTSSGRALAARIDDAAPLQSLTGKASLSSPSPSSRTALGALFENRLPAIAIFVLVLALCVVVMVWGAPCGPKSPQKLPVKASRSRPYRRRHPQNTGINRNI